MSNSVLQAKQLYRTFSDGNLSVDVLKGINMTLAKGEKLAIVGSSGSGKSTLLHCLGGLDLPTQGEIMIKGKIMSALDETERGKLRNEALGFVYQFHHLLPEFSALENVAMPLLLGACGRKSAYQRASDMLNQVGLGQRLAHKPSELSGGERQRAAIARALINQPDCVLADEPTGNLDTKTANYIYDLMLEINQSLNTSFIVVTHDVQLAQKMDRILELSDGQFVA